MSVFELFLTWLVYSVFAYVFLCVVSFFRVRGLWAVFLAGACFGWFEEGIILQTTYGSPDTPFPMSISFTGLAWHALIGVLVGWYLTRIALTRNRPAQAALFFSAIGAFYGLWAIFWWTEPPEQMRLLLAAERKDLILLHFATYSVIATVALALSHWRFDHTCRRGFEPSRGEYWFLVLATLAYFCLVTVPAAPKALWVMPPLLGVTFWALSRNRRTENRPDAIVDLQAEAGVSKWSYLSMFCIPLVAITIYFFALATDAMLRTNMPIFYLSSALGLLLWLASVIMLLK
jgi:hypothetical protein